jgi:predicted TIM-barrel fold metal-dependent hydrolase
MDPFTNGKEEGILSSAREAGISCSVLLPVATAPKQFDSIHRFALQFMGGELISFGGIHPDCDDYKEKLQWIKANGFKGIKLHPDYQNTYFNDIKYKRIISCASELDLIVVTHAGVDPISPTDVHCTPKMIEEVLDEVSPKNLVLAHMGGNLMFDEVEARLVGRDVYFDTSYAYGTQPKYYFEKILESHTPDRIIFGTDSPWHTAEMELGLLSTLKIDENDKEKITHKNALRLLNL